MCKAAAYFFLQALSKLRQRQDRPPPSVRLTHVAVGAYRASEVASSMKVPGVISVSCSSRTPGRGVGRPGRREGWGPAPAPAPEIC
eukprot:scaffold34245_cov23-Tisochrysis_lutea.AAC.1